MLSFSKNTDKSKERDFLFMMLAYAITFFDWQKNKDKGKRGHNIGAVLVDPKGNIVSTGLNSINSENDATQHGELRIVQSYLQYSEKINLEGYSMYATLEPCAMCAGAMTMALLDRVVFGMRDPEFGGTFQKLQLSTSDYPEYPLKTQAIKSDDHISGALDEAFSQSNKHIITFLYSDEAKAIFSDAVSELKNYELKFRSNKSTLDTIKGFIEEVF